MARRSTAKFTTVALSLPDGDEAVVQIYYKKEPQSKVGTFITKSDQVPTSKGKKIFIPFFESPNIQLLLDRIVASVDNQLEPKVEYSLVMTRAGEFTPVKMPDVILREGKSIELTQADRVFATEHEGKVYTYHRPGWYPVSEGVEVIDPANNIVYKDSEDFKALQKKVDLLHEKFYTDVLKLWADVEKERQLLLEKFKNMDDLLHTKSSSQEQSEPVLNEILNTYSKTWS